jgi:hypothetical protein
VNKKIIQINMNKKNPNNNSPPGSPTPLVPIVPIKIYSNAEADKAQILKENSNKSGIYM